MIAQPATAASQLARWTALGAYTAGAVSLALGIAGSVVLTLGAGPLLP